MSVRRRSEAKSLGEKSGIGSIYGAPIDVKPGSLFAIPNVTASPRHTVPVGVALGNNKKFVVEVQTGIAKEDDNLSFSSMSAYADSQVIRVSVKNLKLRADRDGLLGAIKTYLQGKVEMGNYTQVDKSKHNCGDPDSSSSHMIFVLNADSMMEQIPSMQDFANGVFGVGEKTGFEYDGQKWEWTADPNASNGESYYKIVVTLVN